MHAVLHALSIAGSMTWEITWALILGFALSAVVQAVIRRSTVVSLLGDDRPRTLTVAAGLGVASSSCSYAAVALARSLFRKGANFTAAMAFEIASTNLVVELGVILALLMGWQFTAAEFVGGHVMIVLLAVLFRLFLRGKLLRQAREQAERGLAGSMEGHAAMDMSVRREGSFARRLLSREGFTSTSHVFVMEWAAVLRDLVLGLLIAVDGRRYLDGALRNGTNIDLAAGARTVVVIDPLAHRHPLPTTDGTYLVAPDSPTARLLDAERSDPEAWTAACQAGEAQAGTAAEELRAHWRPATDRGRGAPDRPARTSLHRGRCGEID
ncbi:permease [Streptomyces hygroscopicus]|uniref:permease n=1 Tax=Streptomyces hygroscopicus TaxID=1912 RepID=UPI000A550AA1|nr:permease [Streptomyces hygroscopicus]